MASLIKTNPHELFIQFIGQNLKYWLSSNMIPDDFENVISAIKFAFKSPLRSFHERAAALILQSYPEFDKASEYQRLISVIQYCPTEIQKSTRLNLNNLYGICQWKLGNIQQAEKLFTDTINLSTGIKYSTQYADSLYGICLCEMAKNNLSQAKELAQKAIQLYFSQKRAIPIVLLQNILAMIYLLQGNFEKSENFIQSSLEILAALSPNENTLANKTSANLGNAQILHGLTLEGIQRLGQAAQSLYQAGDFPSLLRVEINRSYHYLKLNKPQNAKSALQRSIRLYQQLPTPNKDIEFFQEKLANQLNSQT